MNEVWPVYSVGRLQDEQPGGTEIPEETYRRWQGTVAAYHRMQAELAKLHEESE